MDRNKEKNKRIRKEEIYEEENEFYWYWFVNIKGIGSKTRRKLLDYFGHPKEIYHVGENVWKKMLTEQQVAYLSASRNTNDIDISRKHLADNQVKFIHWQSKKYPENFRQLFDPPYGFYVKGRLPDISLPTLGIVGARNATAYGRTMAMRFAQKLAKNGVQIISGLAAGVDASSHRGALCAGGYTMGILGGGIDTIYPKENFNLYMELYQRGGVLSEYNMGVRNHPGLFPVRNRLISSLSDAVLVIEAGRKSGALITADQALEQGKDVFALPGRITDVQSVGCNHLIAQGASLVQEPDEILEILWQKKERESRPDSISEEKINGRKETFCSKKDSVTLSASPVFDYPEQKKIYELLDEITPISIDMLLEKSGYDIIKIQHILFEMELKQWIYQPNQNVYLKKFL